MTQLLRESAFALLSGLCDAQMPSDSLRIVSHSLLNLVEDGQTDVLAQLRDALPWLSALIELNEHESERIVAQNLASRGGVRVLDSAFVERTLQTAAQGSGQHNAVGNAIRQLAELDGRLVRLSMLPTPQVRDQILGDVHLAHAYCELSDDPSNALRTRLIQALGSPSAHAARALEVLAGLETNWNGGELATAGGFGDRTRRFEMSAVDHLRQHDFLPAVRAALMIGQAQGRPAEQIHGFPIFRNDPPLEQLAIALCASRGAVFAVLGGGAGLEIMSGWAAYLRGPCADLAESRGITLREATSFAHFALHLTNICDLLAIHPQAANDRVRRSIMDIEDDIKEFVLMGQREGKTTPDAAIAKYDDLRWKHLGAAARVADRLARLGGLWRDGVEPAPFGSAARLASDKTQETARYLDELNADNPGAPEILEQLLRNARIMGTIVLEKLDLKQRTALLTTCLTRARDLGRIDVSLPFMVDLTPLIQWFDDPSHPQVLQQLLDQLPLDALHGDPHAESGVRVEVVDGNQMRVVFEPNKNMKAILTLIADTDTDPELKALLRQRVLGPAKPTTPQAWDRGAEIIQ